MFGSIVVAALAALQAPATADVLQPFRERDGARYRADGPHAALYGRGQGFPACAGFAYISDLQCRVGAFSAFEALFPSRPIAEPAIRSALRRASAEPRIEYVYEGRTRSIDDYLDRYPVTGFLIAQGDSVLVERYQYGRDERHRLATFSFAKSIVGLLTGIAISEGAIRSIDDRAEAYMPELKGTQYGRTPLKSLLTMSSGISFKEDYADTRSDIYTLARLTLEQNPAGSLGAVRLFDTRIAAPGERFSYSSLDTVVLGLVLQGATGRNLADYASDKLWKPLGAEASAYWSTDATGREIAFAYYHAVLRDWARVGLMLAHGGAWAGRQVVPAAWIEAATRPVDWPARSYGYQIWVSPFAPSRFYLSGLRQQYLLVDPLAKLILVQISLGGSSDADQEMTALWNAARAQLTARQPQAR